MKGKLPGEAINPCGQGDTFGHSRQRFRAAGKIQKSRPEHMILTHLIVPPVSIRPSVIMDGASGSNEDDLTMKLNEIVHYNTSLGTALEKGATAKAISEQWDMLQVQVALRQRRAPGFGMQLKKISRFGDSCSG